MFDTSSSDDTLLNFLQKITTTFYSETRSYQKNCEWNYIAPPSGWLTVLKVLALDMSDNEVLNVTGSINGNQSTRVFDR